MIFHNKKIKNLFILLIIVLFIPSTSIAKNSFINNKKFLGIRAALDEGSIKISKELGFNAIFVTVDFVYQPDEASFSRKMTQLKKISKIAKKEGVLFFVGWRIFSKKAISAYENKNKNSNFLSGNVSFWRLLLSDPMIRISHLLTDSDCQLDGFIIDIENYAESHLSSIILNQEFEHSKTKVTDKSDFLKKIIQTREELESIKPGMIFGFYPVKPTINSSTLRIWIQGLSDNSKPILLLTEYTYRGYDKELRLRQQKALYENDLQRSVMLIPGFNFLKTPEPLAWKQHLLAFASEADGYWLYPGSQLINKVGVDKKKISSAYNIVTMTNDIILNGKSKASFNADKFIHPKPHESDPDSLTELLTIAKKAKLRTKINYSVKESTKTPLKILNANLFIKAGKLEPIHINIEGKGNIAIYSQDGKLLLFNEFSGIKNINLPVKNDEIYVAIIRNSNRYSSTYINIEILNYYWALRGVYSWSNLGRFGPLLAITEPSVFYFYVPKGTLFFNIFLLDKKNCSYFEIKNSNNQTILKHNPQKTKKNLNKNYEVQVPNGQDNCVWSLRVNPFSGTPKIKLYGTPDLFYTSPEKILLTDNNKINPKFQRVSGSSSKKFVLLMECENFYSGEWLLSRIFPNYSGDGVMFRKNSKNMSTLYNYITLPENGNCAVWIKAFLKKQNKSSHIEIQTNTKTIKKRIGEVKNNEVYQQKLKWYYIGNMDIDENDRVLKINLLKYGIQALDSIILTNDSEWSPSQLPE